MSSVIRAQGQHVPHSGENPEYCPSSAPVTLSNNFTNVAEVKFGIGITVPGLGANGALVKAWGVRAASVYSTLILNGVGYEGR